MCLELGVAGCNLLVAEILGRKQLHQQLLISLSLVSGLPTDT
jgi:hypothetical protein